MSATLSSLIARMNSNGAAPAAPAPTDDIASLLASVADLSAQVQALTREVNALKAQGHVVVSTVGPLPASVGEIASGRAGMRYIATKLGGKANEDSVRKALTNSPAFADLREQAPDLTTNVPLIRWLAGEYDGRMRYTWIASGAATAQDLVKVAAR